MSGIDDIQPVVPMPGPPEGSTWSRDEDGNTVCTYPNGTTVTYIVEEPGDLKSTDGKIDIGEPSDE